MNRRGFMAALLGGAGGLVLPYEPQRVYSFIRRPTFYTGLRVHVHGVEYFDITDGEVTPVAFNPTAPMLGPVQAGGYAQTFQLNMKVSDVCE